MPERSWTTDAIDLGWRTWHRAQNRWWDLIARAAGFCNARPWTPNAAPDGEYRGEPDWRCARRGRHDGPHRSGDFVWDTTGPVRSEPGYQHGVHITAAIVQPRKRWPIMRLRDERAVMARYRPGGVP